MGSRPQAKAFGGNMNDLVRITKDNDVAIITIDNPPVNALSPGVPEEIWAAIDEMNRDAAVQGGGCNWWRPDFCSRRRHQGIRQDDLRGLAP